MQAHIPGKLLCNINSVLYIKNWWHVFKFIDLLLKLSFLDCIHGYLKQYTPTMQLLFNTDLFNTGLLHPLRPSLWHNAASSRKVLRLSFEYFYCLPRTVVTRYNGKIGHFNIFVELLIYSFSIINRCAMLWYLKGLKTIGSIQTGLSGMHIIVSPVPKTTAPMNAALCILWTQ